MPAGRKWKASNAAMAVAFNISKALFMSIISAVSYSLTKAGRVPVV